jgi:hypothetical protein
MRWQARDQAKAILAAARFRIGNYEFRDLD